MPANSPSPTVRVSVSVALVLASLLGSPSPAAAAPPTSDGPGASPDATGSNTVDPELARAKQLFDSGVARYTAADYEAAVDLWLEAYALIPPSYDNRLILAELIYNVARAQQKWFDIDKDVKHLRQAREILNGYLAEVEDLYPAEQVALERERLSEQITRLDEQISAWEAEQAAREAALAERMRPTFDEEADARESRRNKAMIGAGAGLTVLGVGGLGLMVTGLILAKSADDEIASLPLAEDIPERESVIDRGQAGNGLMVTGVLAGAVFLAAGVPLLGVGIASERKRKRRRGDAGLDAARLDHVAPSWIRGGVGLSLGGRF